MADFKLLNHAGSDGQPRPAILVGTDRVVDLRDAFPDTPWAQSTLTVLKAWDEALPALHALADEPKATRTLSDIKLMAPLYYPPAIYCAGSNYVEHGNEMVKDGGEIDTTKTTPYFFLKSPQHCITDPGAPIRLPSTSQKVDWEAEFAVVIGRPGRNIAREDAMKHVAGYTIMNDLSSRDLNMRHDDFARWKTDWFAHKNFEGSAPMGPFITPADQIADPYQLRLQLWVNEEKKQDSLVAGLIFKIPDMIHYLSRRMTLLPGDVIATGTPSGVGRPKGTFLKPGDKVRIELTDVGVLENPVVQGL